MTARFNHTIIASRDAVEMAAFYRDLLEADEVPSWGPFANVRIADGVLLQFAAPPTEFASQHYAYLLDDAHFDRAHGKLTRSGRRYWADPQRTRPGEINAEHGGRGVYVLDPSDHLVELITHPYV